MKKIFSLLLCAALVVSVLPVTVQASGLVDGWIEILEQSSIQPNGENWFAMNGQTTTITVPLGTEKRLARIEMLVWHQTADYPTAASVMANGSTTSLTVLRVDNNLSRIYGTIPNAYYENLNIKFHKMTTGNAAWEMLSCRVTPVAKADYDASAKFWIREDDQYVDAPGFYDYSGDGSLSTTETQFPIFVYDWQKYDTVTISGSVGRMGLNSVRATIHTTGVPYEITFTSTNSSSEYTQHTTHYRAQLDYNGEDYTIDGYDQYLTEIRYEGKVLFNITIDLTGVDRTMKNELVVYFTGVTNGQFGYSVQVTGVVGSVNTADTSDVTWWNRFTTFMTDLFGGDTSESDQFAQDMQQTGDQLADANSQIESMTRPAVEDVPLDPSQFLDPEGIMQTGQLFEELLGNDLVMPMVFITLICGLASFILF